MENQIIKGAQFNFYSKEEWEETPYKRVGGAYDVEDMSIHILNELISTPKREMIMVHEYTHFLQHRKTCWQEMEPLGFKCPITRTLKAHYPEELWVIEAEAF